MVHETGGNDTEEPNTTNRRVVRTDGGSETEQAAERDHPEETSEVESEPTSEPDSASESTDTGEDTHAQEARAHDESEEHEATPSEPAQADADEEAVAEQTGDVGVEPRPDEKRDAERAGADGESASSPDGEGDTASIIEVRNQVIELSTDVIGRSLDGIVEVSRTDDSWRAVVEIIERRSVPDTQDILGQYEIELDESGEVIGYRRLEKYRRGDTGPSQQ
ncbi:gas vesicle protein [Halohasta salina]|uniref:gas vesicle protein GvpO n=1 Tax=Halohasta salina TaxID=2961621 RepID=UPI0020A4E5AC|nr:gas vesicle protein GvpO [Halohasta salina]